MLITIAQFFVLVTGGIVVENELGVPDRMQIELAMLFALLCVMLPYYPMLNEASKKKSLKNDKLLPK